MLIILILFWGNMNNITINMNTPDSQVTLIDYSVNRYMKGGGEEPASASTAGETAEGFLLLIIRQDRAPQVLRLLHELVDGQSKPLAIVMPIRAAMDAGVMRRPTFGQFCNEFGRGKLKSKSSLTDYLCGSYCFEGEIFRRMIEDFRRLMV